MVSACTAHVPKLDVISITAHPHSTEHGDAKALDFRRIGAPTDPLSGMLLSTNDSSKIMTLSSVRFSSEIYNACVLRPEYNQERARSNHDRA